MLPARNRLRHNKDINRVFKQGRGLTGGPLFIKWAANNLDASRFAFIVSKKIARNATDRNRIKRILREAVQKNITAIKAGFDCVLVVKNTRGLTDFHAAQVIIKKLSQKANLLV